MGSSKRCRAACPLRKPSGRPDSLGARPLHNGQSESAQPCQTPRHLTPVACRAVECDKAYVRECKKFSVTHSTVLERCVQQSKGQ